MFKRQWAGTSGMVFHVLNRGVRRMRLFDQDWDYGAFLNLMVAAQQRVPVELLAFCVMPNHFHLVLRAKADAHIPKFMQWFTATHSKRWHVWRESTGTGSVYQGRFKAFPVQAGRDFLTVCRYVERNPLRAGLVDRAEFWRWSSLGRYGSFCDQLQLGAWPIPRPPNWIDWVNEPVTAAELAAVRHSVKRSAPFGEPSWVTRTASDLGIEASLRKPGRRKLTTTSEVDSLQPGIDLRGP